MSDKNVNSGAFSAGSGKPTEEFDKKAQEWYNNNKDASGGVTINTKNALRLNDPNCKHDFYEDPLDPDSSWARVFKCKNCPLGQLVKK